MYRRAHGGDDDGYSAHVRLMRRLKNHIELTHMAYLGGENRGGVATGEGVCLLYSGRRESHRCFRDKMKRYLDCWVRYWSATARSAATAAENKPVCSRLPGGYIKISTSKTHKNEDPICILLPTLLPMIGHIF